jgi:hypothetical protein
LMEAQHEFSRVQFFEIVWSEPMTKLAAKLHISDVAVKKICVRHEIPVPGLGFWAKIAAGHKLERPKLPAASKPQLDQIRIYGSPRAESSEIRTVEAAAKTAEARTDRKIVVPETLENPHPVVRATLQKLRSQKPNDRGCLFCAGPDIFRVSVSPSQLDRALRILNAFTRASEERGFLVQKGENSASLEVNGERINLSLHERIDRILHVQTPAEAIRAAKERKQSRILDE